MSESIFASSSMGCEAKTSVGEDNQFHSIVKTNHEGNNSSIAKQNLRVHVRTPYIYILTFRILIKLL